MPEGDDKDCSGIEDPEKMSEEEKEDVAKKVGEAIEEGNKKAEEEKAAAELLKKAADGKKEGDDKVAADGKKEGDDKAKKGNGLQLLHFSSSSAPAVDFSIFFQYSTASYLAVFLHWLLVSRFPSTSLLHILLHDLNSSSLPHFPRMIYRPVSSSAFWSSMATSKGHRCHEDHLQRG